MDNKICKRTDCKNCTTKNCIWKPKTNADRIRAMSDEEMADAFNGCPSNMYPTSEECHLNYPNCKKCWLGWLQEEV